MLLFDDIFSKAGTSHPHACIIYDDLSAYRKIASRYILEGLQLNEKCIIAVDRYTPQMISDDLKNENTALNLLIQNKTLEIINAHQSYSGNGEFDPDQTIKFWLKEMNKAMDDGFDGLRVMGEMTFFTESSTLAIQLVEYENIVNEVLFPDYPIKSLCVYDRNLYSPEIIKSAISAHPILFYNNELYLDNIHYVPPEIYFKEDKIRDEVEVWLANIKRNNDNLCSLRESEDKFRKMFEKAPLSYQSLDENGNFIEANQTFLKTLGYERHEVIGKNFGEFLHSDWKKHFKKNFPILKSVGEVLGVEFEMIRKDGSSMLISLNGTISRDKDGIFQQTHCVFEDISERRKAEERLIESEAKYRTLFENMAEGVFYQQADGKIIDFNQNALEMFGLSEDQFLGRTSYDSEWRVIHEDGSDFPGEEHPSMVALKTGKSVLGSVAGVFNPIKNDFVWLNINAIPQFKDGQSAPYQAFVTMRDITKLRKAEKELRQAKKMQSIGTMAGGIAHDFNNILYMIIGNTELALEDISIDNPIYENLSEIKSASLKGSRIVKLLLNFTHPEERQSELINAVSIIKDCLKFLKRSLPSHIKIHQNILKKRVSILADPAQLNQVIMNLCNNAGWAIGENSGIINVNMEEETLTQNPDSKKEMKEERKYLKIEVADTGPGIAPEIIDRIFDPYFSTKDIGEGSGMGLSVVHGIVKNHNGIITVSNKAEGGAIFKIYFPIIDM